MKIGLKKMVLLFLLTVTGFNNIKAATYDWTGAISSNWASPLNWLSGGLPVLDYPGQNRNTDVVRFGVSALGLFINQPILTLTSAQSVTVASVTFGPNQFINVSSLLFNGTTLTVNVGTLNVTGSITQNINSNAVTNSTINNFLLGTGTINCSSIQVGSGTNSTTNFNFLFSEVKNLNVTGNVTVIMNTAKQNGCGFRLQAGSMAIGGQIGFTAISVALVNSSNAGYFTIDASNSSGIKSSPTLTLSSANAILTPLPQTSGGLNKSTVNFNGTSLSGGKITIIYTGASPTIYTTSTKGFGSGGPTIDITKSTYDNLIIDGTGTATIGAGATAGVLKLDSALTTSSNTTFANATTTTTIGTNWQNDAAATVTGGAGTTSVVGNLTNAGTMNMGSGNVTVGGYTQNTAGTIQLGTGNFTTGGVQNSGGTIQGGAGPGKVTVGPSSFQNNGGTYVCNAEDLYINGDYQNTSVFTAGTGTVYFNDTGLQSLSDISSAGTVFNKVSFSGGALTFPKTMSGSGGFAVSATGTLSLANNATTKLDAGGVLTLMSNASSTATVSQILNTTSFITGNVNVQRYITGGSGYRGYRLVSSPVNVTSNTTGGGNLGLGYLSVSQSFAGTTYRGALTGGPGTGFFVTSGNPSIYLYDESRTTDNTSFVAGKNVGIYSITGSTVTTLSGKPAVQTAGVSVPVGNSYLFFFIGDNSSTAVSSAARPSPENTTVTAVGYLNQGNVPVKFWNTGSTAIPYHTGTGAILPGYNQVGNPYASTINLKTVYSDNYNVTTNAISPIFWEMNEPGQTYISYNAKDSTTSNTKASKYIVSGQGFIVDATATGQTITFKEDQKVTYPAITNATTPALLMSTKGDIALLNKSFKSTANEPLLTGLHLQLTKDSLVNTQCGIYFNKNWDDGYHNTEDALDLDGMSPKVFMSSYSVDGVRTSINQLGDYAAKGKKVKLFVKATSSGLYTIDLVDIKNIDSIKYKLYLLDHFKKDSLDIGKYKSYNFNIVTTDTTTFGANRFDLSIQRVPGHKYQLATFNAQKATDGILVTWRAYDEGGNYFFTLEKQQAGGTDYSPVYEIQSNGATIYKYTDKAPNTGNNVYRLKQVDLYGNITYSGPVNIYYDKSGNASMFSVYPNPTAETLNVNVTNGKTTTAASSYKLNIYDATGTLVMQKTSDNYSWGENVSQFKPGIYIVELNDNSGNSLGKAKFLKK